MESLGHLPFQLQSGLKKTIMTCYTTGLVLDKNLKNPVSVFRVFDLLFIQLKPYENEFSTALSECKAVARCATRKTDTAINRVKTVGAYKTVDTTCKTNTSIIEKTVGDCKIPIIFNLQHNNDENVTSIITHNRVEINLRYIRNP